MKTSKRLLSILLMLTMLVSMFTVMASADVMDETTNDSPKTVHVAVEGNGGVKVGSNKTIYKTGYDAKSGDVLTAVPDEGYTAQWYYVYATYEQAVNKSQMAITDKLLNANCSLKVKFTLSEEPSKPSTDVLLTVNIEKNGLTGATVKQGDSAISNGQQLKLSAADVVKGIQLTADVSILTGSLVYDEEYTVDWRVDSDKTTSHGNTYTVPQTLSAGKYTLTVTFNKVEKPVVEKHSLTVEATPEAGGTVLCEGGPIKQLNNLAKDQQVTLTAKANDGYKFKAWETTGGAIVTGKETATVTMGNTDATVTAVFEKTTYTVTVKKGVNGTLKYAVNSGDRKTVTETATIPNLKQGDIVKLIATPKSNYETVWTVNGNKLTKHNEVLELTVSEDITVEVSFQKLPSDKLDLELDITNWNRGDVYAKENSEDSYRVRKNNKTFTLEEDDTVKFTAYPEDGYKAVWQLDNGTKYTGSTFTVDYEDMDDDNCVLYLSFVKKSSSDTDDYPTLTFDITGEKYGKVYRGTREYGDGDVISIKKNDKMTFKAKVTRKDYVAVWTYKGDTYVGDEFTVKMGATDAKLYVEFMDKDDIRLTELPFRDVSKRDWYYDDVVYVYRNGYMDGMSSTRFGGELNTTRGQIVTILWRLTGEPGASSRCPFNDVSSRQYYYDAVCWAYEAGVVDGFDAHTFKPDQNVTREQLAAILYRYAEYMNLSTGGSAYLGKYNDENRIANWAYDAMAWANYHGIINGTSATRISPKGYATRAQIAAMLHRFAVEFGA